MAKLAWSPPRAQHLAHFGYLSKGPEGIGKPEDARVPEGLDYDMWLGPALNALSIPIIFW